MRGPSCPVGTKDSRARGPERPISFPECLSVLHARVWNRGWVSLFCTQGASDKAGGLCLWPLSILFMAPVVEDPASVSLFVLF